MHDPDRAGLLAALAAELAASPTETATATAITERAATLVPGADAVSLTLRVRRGRFSTLACTDDLARELDELQYALDEGPCVAAAVTHDWYRSGDVGADDRWPRWGPRAAEHGACSLLSVALSSQEATFGALNYYAREPGAFSDPDEVDLAILFATHAALALSTTRQLAGLQTAVTSRHLIGAAQGVLMERYGLDLDRSFALLQRLSNQTNTRVVDLARELVTTGELPALPENPHAG